MGSGGLISPPDAKSLKGIRRNSDVLTDIRAILAEFPPDLAWLGSSLSDSSPRRRGVVPFRRLGSHGKLAPGRNGDQRIPLIPDSKLKSPDRHLTMKVWQVLRSRMSGLRITGNSNDPVHPSVAGGRPGSLVFQTTLSRLGLRWDLA